METLPSNVLPSAEPGKNSISWMDGRYSAAVVSAWDGHHTTVG